MTSSDTLQQIQAENERLRREVARYRSIFQQLPLGIYVYHLEDIDDDRTLRMADANPIVEQLASLSPEQIIGKTLDENFPGLREQGLPQAFAGVVRSGEGFEAESIYGDDNVVESAWNVIAVPLPDQHVSVMFDNITLRKQAEQEVRRLNTELEQRVNERTAELQRNQALLRGILENSPSAIYVKDLEGRFLLANENTAALMHLSADELVGKVDSDLFPPEYVDHWRANEQQVLDQRQAIEIEETAPMEDGIHTFLSYRIPIYDENGTIYATGGISTDVTQRKRAEEDLKLFQTLVENAPDGISIVGLDGRMTYANPAFKEISGYGDDTIGMSMADFRPAEKKSGAGAIMQEIREKGVWQGNQIYQRKDGSTFPAQVSAFMIYDKQGNPVSLMGIHRDITERKQQEDELRMFKTLVENAPDAISVADLEGKEVYANAMFKERTGYGEQVIGIRVPEIYNEPPEIINQVIQHVIAHGFWQGENSYRCPDGQTIPNLASIFLIRDNDGVPRLIASIESDLRQQRQAEAERAILQEQVIDAQRAALRELSTPLIPISDNVVIMPLIGTIDSARAQMVMEALLEGVALHQAEIVILDITGVQIVDTQVADAFIRAAQAVRLLGASVIMTGIQPQIAQTLVQLGVDLSDIQTHGSLQSGIAQALHIK
jgi:rsbT co-antagonist protein RsbR